MRANTITTGNGIEVYESRIHDLADAYMLDRLTEEERDNPKVDSALFTGLLHKIYTELFKPNSGNMAVYNANTYQNIRQNSILDYNDIYTLDRLFDVYCDLCARYRTIPSLLGFGSMTGVSKESINDWINGKTHKSGEHRQTAKRWKSVCESALESRAVQSNSIGAIFALKAAHGWREGDPSPSDNLLPQFSIRSPEEIAQRYSMPPEPLADDLFNDNAVDSAEYA